MIPEPLTPLPPSVAPVMVRHSIFVAGNMKMEATTTTVPSKTNKWKAEDNNEVDTPTQPPISRKPIPKWKKKFMSDEDEKMPTRTIHVKQRALSVKATDDAAPADTSAEKSTTDLVDDRGFWDADTKPARWGDDSTIATAVEVGKQAYPDKKFGWTRLTCANCDEMKITCAIDGAGVWQRMQDKVKAEVEPNAKHSRRCTPKSRAKTPATPAPPNTTKPSTRSSSRADQKDATDDSLTDAGQQPMDLMPDGADVQAPLTMPLSESLKTPEVVIPAPVCILVPALSSAPTNPPEPEPTPRDILRSILDLSKRFDLLATNERVDALDTKVEAVEEKFSWRLTALEEQFTTSDAHWRSVSSSVGNLSMSLWAHVDDSAAHCPRANAITYTVQQRPDAAITSWLNNAPNDEQLGISTMGREYTHVWDQSVVTGMQGDVGTSASIIQPTCGLDPPGQQMHRYVLGSDMNALNQSMFSEEFWTASSFAAFMWIICNMYNMWDIWAATRTQGLGMQQGSLGEAVHSSPVPKLNWIWVGQGMVKASRAKAHPRKLKIINYLVQTRDLPRKVLILLLRSIHRYVSSRMGPANFSQNRHRMGSESLAGPIRLDGRQQVGPIGPHMLSQMGSESLAGPIHLDCRQRVGPIGPSMLSRMGPANFVPEFATDGLSIISWVHLLLYFILGGPTNLVLTLATGGPKVFGWAHQDGIWRRMAPANEFEPTRRQFNTTTSSIYHCPKHSAATAPGLSGLQASGLKGLVGTRGSNAITILAGDFDLPQILPSDAEGKDSDDCRIQPAFPSTDELTDDAYDFGSDNSMDTDIYALNMQLSLLSLVDLLPDMP
ncbi:hypothetical protein F4604DRAFT_1682331 [Suillus subluteus]|nr:hypothetical protein F4604DRAFT_1682331 [Suillus subluteus]